MGDWIEAAAKKAGRMYAVRYVPDRTRADGGALPPEYKE